MIIKDIVFVYHLKESNLVGWHSRIHSHPRDHYELHYFLSGDGSFQNGSVIYPIQKGQLFLSSPDQVHGIRPGHMDDPLTYYAVLFEIEANDAPQIDLSDPSVLQGFPVMVGANWRLRFEDMKNRYNSRNPYFKQGAHFDLLAFLFDLFGRIADHDRDVGASREGLTSVQVAQAMDLFARHVFASVRLSEIAQTLKITEEYLIKLFKRHIGTTPMRYYQTLKLEASVSLLLNTTLAIKEISWQLCFSSQYHFSRNFKAYAGLSPSEYRLNYFKDNPTNYQTRIV